MVHDRQTSVKKKKKTLNRNKISLKNLKNINMKRIETNVENIIAVKDSTTSIQLRKESLKNSSLPGFDL